MFETLHEANALGFKLPPSSLPTITNLLLAGLAAGRIGSHILSQCKRWLIFVQGVGFKPGAKGYDEGMAGIWPGENLYGAREHPVSLSDPTKLVYSPHTYGYSRWDESDPLL